MDLPPSAILLVGALLAGAPQLVQAQFDASLLLGTRIQASTSEEATAIAPDGSASDVILRQPLRLPWIVGGARLGHVLYRGLSLELGYTGALVEVSLEGESDFSSQAARNASVHTFALRPRIHLGEFGNAIAGHAFAGPALVWRAGAGFEGFTGTRVTGWNFGVGVTLLAGQLRFRADLEDVIYALTLRNPGVIETDRSIQHDILLTVGIVLIRP